MAIQSCLFGGLEHVMHSVLETETGLYLDPRRLHNDVIVWFFLLLSLFLTVIFLFDI